MDILRVGTLNLTPYIAHNGYKLEIEDLERSAERSISNGALLRDRIGRFPTIEVKLISKLKATTVQQILQLGNNVTMSVTYYNYLLCRMVTGQFYVKIKHPSIVSTANNELYYSDFTLTFIGVNRL